MLIKDCNICAASAIAGLDRQLIALTMNYCPNLLVNITELNLSLGPNVHPFLQKSAKGSLFRAITERGKPLEINSGWITIAGQFLLYQQSQKGICGISDVASPGASSHQNATAINIEDPEGWKEFLEQNSWAYVRDRDKVHFDYKDSPDIRLRSILAFQKLWNFSNFDKLKEDGIIGQSTLDALANSPCAGFYLDSRLKLPDRYLMFSSPVQSGKDVEHLQRLLDVLDIKSPTDGVFGTETATGVMRFQERCALIADGVVGEKTWNFINRIDLGDSSCVVSRGSLC